MLNIKYQRSKMLGVLMMLAHLAFGQGTTVSVVSVTDTAALKMIGGKFQSPVAYMSYVHNSKKVGGGMWLKMDSTWIPNITQGRRVWSMPTAQVGYWWVRYEAVSSRRTIEASWAGAVNDGTTDNLAALQAAVNSGAKTVLLDAGTYNISTTTSTITLADSVALVGKGGWNRATTIKSYRTTTGLVGNNIYNNAVFTVGAGNTMKGISFACKDSVSCVIKIDQKKGFYGEDLEFLVDKSDGCFIHTIGGRNRFVRVRAVHNVSFNTQNTFSCFAHNINDVSYADKIDTTEWFDCHGESGGYVWGGTVFAQWTFFNCTGDGKSNTTGGNVFNLYSGCQYEVFGGKFRGHISSITPSRAYSSKLIVQGARLENYGSKWKLYSSDVSGGTPRAAQDTAIFANNIIRTSVTETYVSSPSLLWIAPGTHLEFSGNNWRYDGTGHMFTMYLNQNFAGDDSTEIFLSNETIVGGGLQFYRTSPSGKRMLLRLDNVSVTQPDTSIAGNGYSMMTWKGVDGKSYIRNSSFINMRRLIGTGVNYNNVYGTSEEAADSVMELTNVTFKTSCFDAGNCGTADAVLPLSGNYKLTNVVVDASESIIAAVRLHANSPTITLRGGIFNSRSTAGVFVGTGSIDAQNVSLPGTKTIQSTVALANPIWYQKGNYYIIKYTDSGTTRYKYLDMTGTATTWVHGTSEP